MTLPKTHFSIRVALIEANANFQIARQYMLLEAAPAGRYWRTCTQAPGLQKFYRLQADVLLMDSGLHQIPVKLRPTLRI